MKIIYSKDIPLPGTGHDETSTFLVVRSPVGRSYNSRTSEGKVLYNQSGILSIRIGDSTAYDLRTGKLAFIPPMSDFSIAASEPSCFYIYRISVRNHFTESSLPLQLLYDVEDRNGTELTELDAHDSIDAFFSTLAGIIEDELTTHLFYTRKAHELLFLMRSYYDAGELAAFFRPLIERDHDFADFIMENYRKHRTVQELAATSCHSVSAFSKLFRRTFGRSPYSWMKKQRANDIYYDLTSTNDPIKEISSRHGFGSLSQFTNFCKSQFGVPPRMLRELHGEKEKIKTEL